MSKFYGRNGGVRLSQMPFNRRLDDEPLRDIMTVDDIGDKKRFAIKVIARDEQHAERILMGVINSVYVGVTITDAPYSLFADFSKGYNLFDYTSRAVSCGDNCYNVISSGRLVYYD